MGVYHFRTGLIDRIDLEVQDKDELRAYLHASAGASSSQLANCANRLQYKGYKCTPVAVGGEPVLEVRGRGDEEALIGLLAQSGFTRGQPHHISEEEVRKSWKEKLENRKLQASGLFYLVGDVSYFLSGWKGSKWEEKAAGALYGAGSAVIYLFGKNNTGRYLDDVSKRVGKYLHKEGVNLPEECCISKIYAEKESRLPHETALDFLHKYPSETLNGLYVLAGVMVAKSGLRNKRGMDRTWDFIAGASTASSAAGTLLVKEKHRDPDEPARQGLAGVWDWIQEKPNRIAGYGFILSTMMHAASAFREYRHDPKQKSYIYKFIFAGINIVAEVLMAESHQTSGAFKDDKEARHTILNRAAELIAAQPADMRDPLIHHVAGFFSTQPDMAGTAVDFTKELRQYVGECLKNPWAPSARHHATPEQPKADWAQRVHVPAGVSPDIHPGLPA